MSKRKFITICSMDWIPFSEAWLCANQPLFHTMRLRHRLTNVQYYFWIVSIKNSLSFLISEAANGQCPVYSLQWTRGCGPSAPHPAFRRLSHRPSCYQYKELAGRRVGWHAGISPIDKQGAKTCARADPLHSIPLRAIGSVDSSFASLAFTFSCSLALVALTHSAWLLALCSRQATTHKPSKWSQIGYNVS